MRKILLSFLLLSLSMSIASAQCNNRPLVNSFSPNTGFIGSTVTITGANFDATTITNNKVFFGATEATVQSATFGQLVVTVPVGASTARIAVTNQCNLTAYSDAPFNGIFCPTPLTASTYDNTSFELTGIYGAYNMLAVDMDLDGRADVVSSTNGNNLTIARNTSVPSNLSFVAHNFAGQGSQSIYTADFDGDGRQDLASRYSVFLNTSSGPGDISIAAGVTNNSVSDYQIAAGDFNNDGKIDIIGESGANIYIGENLSTGVGNVSFGSRQLMHNVGGRATGIQTADVDGDGKIDILISQRNNHRAATLRNITPNGSSTFVFEAPEYWSVGGTQPYRCQIADFNKDGKIDFTTCNYDGTYNTAVLINSSIPGDINMSTLLNLPSFRYNYRIQVGDVDGDGYPDIVSKSLGLNLFAVYRNTTATTGTTSFAPRIDYNSSATNEVSGIVIGDLDGDFVPDIATSGINSNTIRFHRNTSSQLDLTAPTAICQNITVALEPNGTVSITPEMVDNGSSDACGIDAITLSQTAFTCADTGANPVTLYVLDNAGNLDSCSAVVTVRPAAIIVSGQTTVCDGQTVPLTANLGDSYQWMNNGVNIPGATSQNYTATITGDYTVVVTNAGGCSGESDPTTITVNNNPTVAVSPANVAYLCPTTVVLSASQSAIYQWKFNGVDIPNATLQSYTANQVGSYTVEVIDLFGCSAISDPIAVITTAAEINVTGNALSILDGDISPDAADGTDFGNTLPNTNVVKTFTIANSGTSTMDISSINVSGADAANWTISGITLPATVASNSSISFDAVFNGTAIQTYNATIDITSNDCDESDYNFAVTSEITCVSAAFSACPGNINAYTSNSCDAVVNFVTTATGTNPVTGTYSLSGATTGSGAGDASGLTYNIGTTTVTVTATNACGAATCSFDVIVSDTTSPNAISQNLTVYLDATGNASLTANDIDNGSNDACGIASTSIDISTFNCSNVGPNNVLLTVTDNNGNTSSVGAVITVVDSIAPTAVAQDVTVYLDSTGNGSIKVFDIENGSSDNCGVSFFNLDNSDFNCGDVGLNTVTLTVFDVNGNTSTATATVTVIDDIAPTAIAQDLTVYLDANGNAMIQGSDIDNGSSDTCGIATVTVSPSTFDCTDVNGDESLQIITDNSWTLSTSVDETTALSFPWPGAQYIPAASTFTLPVVLGQPYGYPSISVVPGSDLINANRHITYYRKTFNLTSVDNLGARIQLAIDDDCEIFINGHLFAGEYAFNSATFQGAPMGLFIDTLGNVTNGYNGGDAFGYYTTTSLDSILVLGENEIIIALRNRVGGDRGGLSMVMDVFADFTGNAVTLTVTDVNGNTSTANANVTVVDDVDPVVVTQDITVYLDAAGNTTITAADIDNGSSDACGVASTSLDITSFGCANVGANTVTLTAVDNNGNSSSATATVTVIDLVPPTVVTQNVTVYLDANGNASIAASDIDNGSSDNCAVGSIAVSPSTFDCSDVNGDNSLQVVTDSTWSLSTVVDSSTALTFPWVGAPFVPATSTFTLPVQLGQPYGYPSIVLVPGSDLIDANKHVTYYRQTFNLTTLSQLATRIRMSVDDDLEIFINGNLIAGEYAFNASSFQGVPHDMFIDQTGTVTNGYNGGDTYGYVSNTALDSIFVVGENEIIVAVRNRVGGDRGGLSMVMDVFADFQGNAVSLTVTDVNGNSATGPANVTVIDTVAPVLVQVPASFTAYTLIDDCTPPVYWAPPTATDACAVQSVSGTSHPGDHFPVGVTTVTYTALDIYGNSTTSSFDVTVVDTIAPTAICTSITVGLDAGGFASITAADIDGGSSDICGIASTSIDMTSFDPTHVGAQNVTLTVVDIYGNTSTCTSIVNVIDTIAPNVVCQDITIGLGSNGLAGITAADINNGSSDASGIASMSIDVSSFSCATVGSNTVTLMVTDNNGNSASCMANVTVVDTTAPVVVTQNITISLSSAGQATITPSDIDGGSSDACGIATYDIDINSFGCNELGANTVHYTVTDVNGNSTTQLVTVTVEEGFVVQMQTLPNIDVACNTGLGGKIINWDAPQVATSTSCAPDACPAGNNIPGFIYLGTHDGHRYFCSDNSNYTWNQANAAAQAAGGHLAVINNQAENHYLACRVQAVYSWIGLNDVATEGQFEWVNGDAVTYTNWTGYEPNNTGGYYCGANCYGQGADQTVLKRWSGSWYDRRECNKHEFIMEVPCGNDVVVTQIAGPSAGSLFTTGTSTITYAAVDTVTGASDTTSFNITIGDCTPVYCAAKGVCSTYEWINRIEMGSIDNTSGNDNGYGDFTNMVTNHNKGQKVYFKLHPGFQGSKYKEYWRIFVDWNNDGDFYDYNECVYQGKSKNKKSGNFKVPHNAAAGNLRVRVVMKWGGYAGPCSIFSYGEVEDYTIVVDNASGSSSKFAGNNDGDNNFTEDGPIVNQELFNLYPNPVLSGGEMTLDLRSAYEEEVELTISSATGQIVFTQKAQLREGLNSLSIKPGDLSSGAYFIQISNTSEAIPFVVKE